MYGDAARRPHVGTKARRDWWEKTQVSIYWIGSCCESGPVQWLCMMGCRMVYEEKRAGQCRLEGGEDKEACVWQGLKEKGERNNEFVSKCWWMEEEVKENVSQ